MEYIDKLEERVDSLIQRIRRVEAENFRLREELEQSQKNREEVVRRIDSLLKKVEEVDID
ncbi:MAG: hypothetical protein ACLFTB_01960 [Desulfovibrionales bacterium]